MPILAGGQVVIAPPPPLITPPTIPYREDVGTMTAVWVDPDGIEWPLTTHSDDIGWLTMNGPAGWGATPIELVTDALPRGGEQVRYIRSKPRRIQWPLYIYGDTYEQFVARWRSIVRAFTKTSHRAAPGYLKVTLPSGEQRLIEAYYEEGFEGKDGENWLWAKPVITLYCPDGFWSATQPVTTTRTFAAAGPQPGFLTPFMTISSSKLVGGGPSDPATPILNPGDVDAWPVWTITGPMTQFIAINETLGVQFKLTYTLAAGQQITVRTSRPAVRGPGDTNLTKHLDWFGIPGSVLWPLTDGTNMVAFQVSGAGVGTQVDLAFTPRYETA